MRDGFTALLFESKCVEEQHGADDSHQSEHISSVGSLKEIVTLCWPAATD